MKQRQKFRASESPENKYKDGKGDEIELTCKSFNEQTTIETEVHPEDTLQALSIRYHCPVAELKRLNNLHRENEIHAHRTIKVPFRAFAIVGVHKSGDSSPNANLSRKSIDADILKEKLTTVSTDLNNENFENDFSNCYEAIASGSQQVINGGSPNFNQIIFNTRIIPKVDFDEEVNTTDVDTDEEVQLLPNVQVVTEPVRSEYNCNGHDWGLSWPILLGVILTVAIVVPLVFLYIEVTRDKSKHS